MAEDVTIFCELPASKKPRLDTDALSLDKEKPTTCNIKTTDIPNGTLACEDEPRSTNSEGNTEVTAQVRQGTLINENNGEKLRDTAPALDDSDNMSDISNLSGISEDAWQSHGAGSMLWVHRQMMSGADPREILQDIIPSDVLIPNDVDSFTLWKIIVNIISEPPRRQKLSNVNKLDDVLHLLMTCEKIMVLTGAGVSVSCGIPDFRSRNGIYARLAVDFPDLPDPQAMFDIRYFTNDPRPFFKFAKEIYPGQFEPSKSHKFIKLLEDRDKLLRNYTQNIDTLEQVAGIKNIIQCHGSFATATCMVCKYKMDAEEVKADIFNQIIPHCPNCPSEDMLAVMKPDIVFFGESLPEEFHKQMAADKDQCDLLIVIGSSLKVRPVALIPNSLPPEIPQVLINREPLQHMTFDVELLGNCDSIVAELCKRLQWEGLVDLNIPHMEEVTRDQLKTPPPVTPVCDVMSDKCERVSSTTGGDKLMDTKDVVDRPEESNAEADSAVSGKNSCVSNEAEIVEVVSQSITDSGISSVESTEDSITTVDHTETSQNLGNTNISDVQKYTKVQGEVTSSTAYDENVAETKENVEAGQTKQAQGEGEEIVRMGTSYDKEDDQSLEESDLELMRSMWQPKRRESLSQQLEDNQFLFLPPSRYVFPGAEVYYSADDDSDEDDEDDKSSDISSGSSSIHIRHYEEKMPSDEQQETGTLTRKSEAVEEGGNACKSLDLLSDNTSTQSLDRVRNCEDKISSNSIDSTVTDDKDGESVQSIEQQSCICETSVNNVS